MWFTVKFQSHAPSSSEDEIVSFHRQTTSEISNASQRNPSERRWLKNAYFSQSDETTRKGERRWLKTPNRPPVLRAAFTGPHSVSIRVCAHLFERVEKHAAHLSESTFFPSVLWHSIRPSSGRRQLCPSVRALMLQNTRVSSPRTQ